MGNRNSTLLLITTAPSLRNYEDIFVDEHNMTPPAAPIAQTDSAPVLSSPGEPVARPEMSAPQTPTAAQVVRALEEITSQNTDQISFLRSTHELMVDLSNRVRQITDEASSRAQRTLLVELVMLHDSLEQALAWIRDSNDMQPQEAIVDRIETLKLELLEILMRREVRPYDGEHQFLDRRLHRTVRTLPTSDPNLNDRVERVVRPGFFWREQVLRPEEVVIFKHKPELPEEKA